MRLLGSMALAFRLVRWLGRFDCLFRLLGGRVNQSRWAVILIAWMVR